MGMSWARTLVRHLAVLAVVAAVGNTAFAQLPFFPGAEGFGGTFTGTAPAAGWFSNATVYHVTTLQDDLGPDEKGAPGTLRGAFRENTTNKIIVFDVAGTIQLNSSKTLDIKNLSNYYIAGQTAPGPVTIYNNTSQITASNNRTNSNVILRYLTFRKGMGSGEDAITFANGGAAGPSHHMIIDHVSASWSEDEVLSVAGYNTNVSVQYSMMTDSLSSSDHQFGSLMRPQADAQVTFHHNLYGNDRSRNPRVGSYNNQTLTLDFVDNVIYNWSFRAGYAGGGSDSGNPTEKANVNWVGNYAIAGPATPDDSSSTTAMTKDIGGSNPLEFKVYQSLNLIDSNHNAVRDGTDTGWNMFRVSNGAALPETDKSATPFAAPAVTTQPANEAYNTVMDYVGNWWWNRDIIDQRIIGNVKNNTQPVGGVPASAPVPSELTYVTNAAYPNAPLTHPVGYDADGDAIADAWESKHGGNLVWNSDFDSDGYINLIEFVNELGEFPAPAPIVFNGATNSRYAQITNWKTNDGGITAGSNWQPSRFDEAQINSGTVVVDAIGQHAGVLKIGATAGSNGHLQVNSGWLEVADTIVVGAHATGQGTLTLAGGQVVADAVVVGFNGQLRGTGTLTGDVTNAGVVLPGSSPGTLTIEGNFTQLVDGDLSIDLASAVSYDKLIIHGNIAHGGLLQINLLGGYVPTEGTVFDVIDWTGTRTDEFDLLALPDLGTALTWDFSLIDSQGVLSVVAAAAALAGDYNDDGTVDAADYTVWRDALNSATSLPNETASIGTVDQLDYDAWKSNFGATADEGGGSIGSVPEPSCFALFALGLASITLRRQTRRS